MNTIDLIKHYEGCRLKAYQDSVGVWTIGYGHTRGVKEGDTCTQEQADEWLADDMKHAEDMVRHLVHVALTEGQLGALTSFVFNLGADRLARSTLLKHVESKNMGLAAQEFPKWVYAGGHILQGLVERRLAEQAMFIA